jgi:hypothetical protein
MADLVIDQNQVNLYFDEPAMRRLVNEVMVKPEESIETAINALASQEVPDEWMIVDLWQKLLHRIWTLIFASYEKDYNSAIEKIHLYAINLLKEAEASGTVPAPASTPEKKPDAAEESYWYSSITNFFYSVFGGSTTAASTSTSTSTPPVASATEGGAPSDTTVPVVRTLAEKLEIVKKFYPEHSTFSEVAKLYPKREESTPPVDEKKPEGEGSSDTGSTSTSESTEGTGEPAEGATS